MSFRTAVAVGATAYLAGRPARTPLRRLRPVRARRPVYETPFQEFPSFMKKIVSVDQTADEKLDWKAKVFWSSRKRESTIVEQVPDRHII